MKSHTFADATRPQPTSSVTVVPSVSKPMCKNPFSRQRCRSASTYHLEPGTTLFPKECPPNLLGRAGRNIDFKSQFAAEAHSVNSRLLAQQGCLAQCQMGKGIVAHTARGLKLLENGSCIRTCETNRGPLLGDGYDCDAHCRPLALAPLFKLGPHARGVPRGGRYEQSLWLRDRDDAVVKNHSVVTQHYSVSRSA